MVEVLLLPGMDGTGRLYSRLIQALPKGLPTTVLTYPSDGVVGYDELLERVRSIAPDSPYLLVAESYSTPLAIQFAATRPEHLKGMVLCAGFGSSPVMGWKRFLVGLISPALFRLPLSDWSLRHFLTGEGAEPALVEEVRATIASVQPEVLSARLQDILGCDVLDELPKVDVPMLYIQAQGDRLVGPRCFESLLQAKDDMRVQRIGGPHLLLQLEPELTAAAIARFVRDL
jgi:pimeloyl-[acyl-carrier protein] methyl ester esterase